MKRTGDGTGERAGKGRGPGRGRDTGRGRGRGPGQGRELTRLPSGHRPGACARAARYGSGSVSYTVIQHPYVCTAPPFVSACNPQAFSPSMEQMSRGQPSAHRCELARSSYKAMDRRHGRARGRVRLPQAQPSWEAELCACNRAIWDRSQQATGQGVREGRARVGHSIARAQCDLRPLPGKEPQGQGHRPGRT